MFKSLFLLAIAGMTFTGCRKNDSEIDKDTASAYDNALAEATFNDVANISDEASTGSVTSLKGGSSDGILSACATVTFTTTPTDTIMTIDFGPVNCMCLDGRNRRGQIIVTWSGAYKDPGHVHTITFNNYFVNDNQVLGTKTVTNNGINGNGNLSYSIDVNGSIILSAANGGGTISWTSQRTREFILGSSTIPWGDDVYLITGSASGTSSKGHSFTATITNAVRKELACHFLVSGTIEFNLSGKAMRTIDFGNGTCDNQATVTINGNVYNITLK